MDRKSFLKLLALAPIFPVMNSLSDLAKVSSALPNAPKMPVLFLGHGSPMNAIEENAFVKGFRDIALTLPKPKAILCVSAHWFTAGTKVTAMNNPRTIYDFGGFPKALYEVKYPAKGNPELAKETQKLLLPNLVDLDTHWGLDHGAWTVIKHLYPNADVPVIQLSIDYQKPPDYHYQLAQQLKSLRDKGILIIGSGNIIHNLGLVDFDKLTVPNYGYDWAIEAHQTLNTFIREENISPLLNYHQQGKAIQLAIPSPDHYLPLIYSLGLKDKKEDMFLFNDELLGGSLSMTSLKIG